ncbi:hypothetical protein SHBO111935_18800 [Shigella boydii]|uniref:Uncharacterized protein n=2 Tax=Shigella TaxID=620 RepID=A0A3P6KJ48_SHIDY|nr:Uncharacterised protein [Shigella dysenteriae]
MPLLMLFSLTEVIMGFRLLRKKKRKMQRIFAILAIIDIQTKKNLER